MKSLAFKQSIKLALLFGVLLPLTAAPVLANAATNTPASDGGNVPASGAGVPTVSDPEIVNKGQQGNKTATFEVVGGDLYFKSVPSFKFTGKIGVSWSNLDGTPDKDMVIQNDKGKDHPWSVSVALGDFKDGTTAKTTVPALAGTILNLTPKTSDISKGVSATVGAKQQTLVNADTTGMVSIPLTATLDAAKAKVDTTGSYTAALTYTLSNPAENPTTPAK